MILHHRCSHIRKSAGQSLFAAHRSLSQLVTSFIGSQCQGILHILFFAWTTFSKQVSFETNWFTLVLRFFSRLNCCVYHTCSLQDLVFIFVWQNCLIFTLTEKPDFNLIDFLVSLYFCLSCMSHRFFLKNLYDFSYSVFNEHSLNFRQGRLAFTKLLRYLNLFKYLRRSVISLKELFSFFLGSSGLEPPTSRLSGARSNQLSYEPVWRWWDSNPWPPACRAGALPTELHPHVVFCGSFLWFQWSIAVSQQSYTENWTTSTLYFRPYQ